LRAAVYLQLAGVAKRQAANVRLNDWRTQSSGISRAFATRRPQ
jgi:hypothetical protein